MAQSLSKLRGKGKTASFPYLVLAVSLLLSLAVAYNFHQSAKNKDRIRFASETNRLSAMIENKINLYVALLQGGRGFIESNSVINRRNFSEYVRSLELEKNHTGIEGIGYIQAISSADRPTFIEKIRAEGNGGFDIFPVAEKPNYQVVAYLEPSSNRSPQIVGFDISSNREWSEAATRAAASGEAAASGKVALAPEAGDASPTGFVIYLPVYKNDGAADGDKSKKISGFIFSLFRADEFLHELQINQPSSDIAIKIYDGSTDDANLLMQTAGEPNAAAGDDGSGTYSSQRSLAVRDENWIVRFESAPVFTAQSGAGWTPVILITGVILSLLLFGMTYWETFARIKLQATAFELSELEQQKQGLLEKEQKARLSAEQANRTKDEFIAVVSHELRTPLNTIAGWTNILKSTELSENTKKLALEKIEKNLRSQTKLVEELLDYSQIVSGTATLEAKEFVFAETFENVFSEVNQAANEKKIEFLKDNRLNGQRILGDENKIKLVIYNLLSNALKFTDAGGKVETVLSEDDGKITMRVKDNGKGISPDFLPNIFDRFTQADSSSTRGSGGLGLGLTISYHIVKLHNGTLEAVSSGNGEGSEFTVIVPVSTKRA